MTGARRSSSGRSGSKQMDALQGVIPQLNLERFGDREEERTAFLAELRHAARHVGFFYLVGHGIEPELLGALMDSARRFFALTESDKLAAAMVNSPHFRGYARIAGERTRGLQDWREQIDIGAEQPAFPLAPGAPAWMRLRGPNQWPAALPELRPAVLHWQAAATRVLTQLMRAFALSLGQREEVFEPLYLNDPHILVKLIRYPGRELTGSDQGVGAHKDSGLLSLLLQDQQGGLQVETAQGWVDVVPRPGALVVNIGELLELASDGYLRATLHRVITPPVGRQRISAAFFLGARLDATVPLLSLPAELAAQARGPDRDPTNTLFRDVGQNYLKGRLRSHPDVAQRYYADLADSANPARPSRLHRRVIRLSLATTALGGDASASGGEYFADYGTGHGVFFGQSNGYPRPAIIRRKGAADVHAFFQKRGRKIDVRQSHLEENEVS